MTRPQVRFPRLGGPSGFFGKGSFPLLLEIRFLIGKKCVFVCGLGGVYLTTLLADYVELSGFPTSKDAKLIAIIVFLWAAKLFSLRAVDCTIGDFAGHRTGRRTVLAASRTLIKNNEI